MDTADIGDDEESSFPLQRLYPRGGKSLLQLAALRSVLTPKPVVVTRAPLKRPLGLDERGAHSLLKRRRRAKLHVRQHRVNLLNHAPRAQYPPHLENRGSERGDMEDGGRGSIFTCCIPTGSDDH